LVSDGLVLRERGGPDRRLLYARLTPAGRACVEAAALTHDALVGELLAVLDGDAGLVTNALARVSSATGPR
jgi:DNA-binding MarR family transcriptional regulator